MSASPSPPWVAGSFPRDTLIHAFGQLSDEILARAAADSSFRARYKRWLRGDVGGPPAQGATRALLTTGLKDGRATVLARARLGEFCVHCQHDRFEALVAVGYNLDTSALDALFIPEFFGDPLTAIRFARELRRNVRDEHNPSLPEWSIGKRLPTSNN